MTDLRGMDTPEELHTSNRSKIIAALVVAVGATGIGGYVYESNTRVAAPLQQTASLDQTQPLTPPPAPAPAPSNDNTTNGDTTQSAPPPIAAPQPQAAAPAPVQHVARVREHPQTPSQVNAPVPPDTTPVPDNSSQTAAPETAPVQSAPAPDTTAPQNAQPQSTDQSQTTPQSTPQ